MSKLLKRLQSLPFAEERQELGFLLCKHKNDLTKKELIRYNYLIDFLKNKELIK